MFVRITHLSVKPRCWDEAVILFKETTFPLLEKEPGFMRVLLTGDAASRKAVLITMWQTPQHAERYQTSGESARLLEPFVDLLEGMPEVSAYPVLFDREF